MKPPGQADFKGQQNEYCALKNLILFSTYLKFYVFNVTFINISHKGEILAVSFYS
jgi:hypothetical protein